MRRKNTLISLAVLALAQSVFSQKLLWEDNFDGDTLDYSAWEHCPDMLRADNSQWEHNGAYLDGKGNLLIRIRKDENDKIKCGAIQSVDKDKWTFGYFEICCKIPKIRGAWTAFWMLPYYSFIDDPGTKGTEIDIMESAQPQYGWINHALHWGTDYGDNHKKAEKHVKEIPGLYDGFHTYACHWTKDEYVFYVDGIETWRTSAGGVTQVPGFMKITAEAAKWAGDAQEADLPAYMVVDYVRVYGDRPNRDNKLMQAGKQHGI